MSPKHTIVIASGGWHTPTTYTKLTKALTTAGFEVHIPPLPTTSNAHPPTADLTTDSTVLQTHVTNLCNQGHHVLVLAHSYGGQVATNALCNLSLKFRAAHNQPGGILSLIYMTASALPEGTSMIDKVREMGNEDLMPLVFDFADDMSVVCRDVRNMMIGPGASDDEAESYMASMVGFDGKAMYQPLDKCAWREIPVVYIYAMQDMILPIHYQRSEVEIMRGLGVHVDTFEVESGHCPNLTATDEVVAIVQQVADKFVGS